MTSSLLEGGQYSSSFILHSVTFNVFENNVVGSGSNLVANVPFAAGHAGHFEYVVRENSNIRTGDFYFTWDGSATPVHYDVSTIDIGDTSQVYFETQYSSSNCQLRVNVPYSGWQVRGLLKIL
jgi:hypothetical protein